MKKPDLINIAIGILFGYFLFSILNKTNISTHDCGNCKECQSKGCDNCKECQSGGCDSCKGCQS